MATQRQLRSLTHRGTQLSGALLVALSVMWPHVLAGQPQSTDSVQVGDQWVYETKDESTGFPKETYTQVVTDVSAKEIVVSTTVSGKDFSWLVTYDHDWGRIDSGIVKFAPSDGQGVRLPLAVGKEWRSEYQARNVHTGTTSKGSVISKVVAQETVTTEAGTFETFKIETRIRDINAADPSKLWEYENVSWYAPEINHWVRRTIIAKFQKRTRSNTSEELADFGRKL